MTPWRLPSSFAPWIVSGLMLASPGLAQPAPPPAPEAGIAGVVTDAERSAPVEGVTVTLIGPARADAASPAEDVRQSDGAGAFAFEKLATGRYKLRFQKGGYRTGSLIDLDVAAGHVSRADFSLEALPEAAELGPDVEEFVVIAPPQAEILAASRLDADELINTLNADDFAKLAIGDVADALKFVPGVNVVEGQFAVIRGLEDRYSSTLYNGAVVPSPDPDRQSVQLDLFPSDIVADLRIAKTFAPDAPGNSSAGSIDILTHDYPEEMTLKLSGGSGFSSRAWDDFLEYHSGSSAGTQSSGWHTLESDYGALLGGRTELGGRELRFKAIVNNEVDYETAEGYQQGREPKRCLNSRRQPCRAGDTPAVSGDLALGELSLSNGKFDLTDSERTEQFTGYLGFGFDVDEAADHTIDGSGFYTNSESELVQLRENGYLPGFDYGALAEKQANGDDVLPQDFDGFASFGSPLRRVRPGPDDDPSRGPLWYSSFGESKSFDTTRDLQIYQLNGAHAFESLDGLELRWATNYAKTTQHEDVLGMGFFYEPDDVTQIPGEFPVSVGDLGPGRYASNGPILRSSNDISERQNFARLDAIYDFDVTEYFQLELSGGGWYEQADRDVTSTFLEGANASGSSQFVVFGDTLSELGRNVESEVNGFLREGSNASSREIDAWNVGSKGTFWEDFDLLAGLRYEEILIESNNDPFTGDTRFGAPATFPEAYLFFDRLDNPARGEVAVAPAPDTVFNDELLGIEVPIDPATGLVDLLDEQSIRSLVDGRIDETYLLPSVGFSYRALEGMSLRGAWSRSVARPSFREMGFYVSVEPGTDDLVVGNPQLQLSEVESYDLRAEYSWGEYGDLAALSLFYKTIDDPIESIVIRNPLNFEASSSSLYRTFFNNPNQATLQGIELEGRKSLGFIGPEWSNYFSLGGNFTYIDAEVGRTDAELMRARPFFGAAPGDPERYKGLEENRRLFGQPEWIANADFSFDHPDWGTKVTLAYFAISSVLDAAGSAFIQPNGLARDFVLDRYVGSFGQLDLVFSQRIFEGLTLRASAKNLTDSKRQILYDEDQTNDEIAERSYRIGRDYSISLSYTYEF